MNRRLFIEQMGLAVAGIPLLVSCADNPAIPKLIDAVQPEIKKGATIAITAPCGAVFNQSLIDKTVNFLKEEGFRVKLGKTLNGAFGYFSAKDKERVDELNSLFADKEVDIILCARGGWGCNRIIPFLDLEVIKNNPKPLMGFSDVTSLLNYLHFETGMITYHSNVAYSSWGEYSYNSIQEVVFDKTAKKIQNHHSDKPVVFSNGRAEGKLIGGNLTVLCSMIGTNYEPQWENGILCLEETHEEPYRIDRMLCQLKDNGVFDKVNAIVIGQFNKCAPEEPNKSFSLDEVLQSYFQNQNYPVISNMSFGHVANKFSIPIGKKAVLDTNKQQIELV